MPDSQTTVRLLGQIGAARDGLEIPLGPTRERECFAALVLRRGTPMLVDQLADHLWGRFAPASAVSVVHTYISRLRGRLVSADASGRQLVRSLHPGYLIDADAVELDVDAFESDRRAGVASLWVGHIDQAREALQRALGRWQGGIALHGATGPLALQERQRLAELHLDVIEHLIALRLHAGDRLDSIADLSTLVGKHPMRERLWSLFMLALAMSDRRGEALMAYHDLRRCLRDDLGINPSFGIQRLFDDLLADKPPTEVWDDHFRLVPQR